MDKLYIRDAELPLDYTAVVSDKTSIIDLTLVHYQDDITIKLGVAEVISLQNYLGAWLEERWEKSF
jgi:hypothetical protein